MRSSESQLNLAHRSSGSESDTTRISLLPHRAKQRPEWLSSLEEWRAKMDMKMSSFQDMSLALENITSILKKHGFGEDLAAEEERKRQ